MEVDEWQGPSVTSRAVLSPSDEVIIQGIRSLDATTKTLLTLEVPSSAHLTIGGGLRDQFIVAYGDEAGMPFSVIGSGKAGHFVEMIVGGQESEFSSENIVDAGVAFSAAAYFARTGQMNPALTWRED